jgi:hypothetical protein
MPLTVVDLCNMALAHIRQRPVAGDASGALGDTPEATNCRRFYDVALREAHRAFDWPFTRQFIQGVKIAGAGVPNWKFAYEIPNGVELIRHVVQNDRTEAPVQFKLMRTSVGGADRRAIFCNEDGVWLSCTRYIADPSEYPSDFVEFASLTLASHLAMPITGKAELMMGMRKMAEDAGKRAALAAQSSETDGEGNNPPRDAPRTQQVPVDVANAALALLGQDAIVAFGDRTKAGDMVRRFYRQAIDMTMRAVDWPFARAYIAGAPTALPANDQGWTSAYAYPADIYDVRRIVQTVAGEDIRFQIRRPGGSGTDRLILSNKAGATFVCTAYVSDAAEYPAEFITAAAARLAAMMALPITGKADVAQGMAENAAREAAAAMASMSRLEAPDMGAEPEADSYDPNAGHVQIANLALGHLAQPPIMAFSEHTKAGEWCRRFYRQAFTAALRAVDWPFARVVTAAIRSDAPPIPGWRYAFAYPENCAALRAVPLQYPLDHEVRFKIVGRAIYANRPAMPLCYTRADPDPASFDPEFVNLVSYELAALIGAPLTGKGDATVMMMNMAKATRDKARADAMNEEPNETEDRVPDWLAARGVPSLTREDRERSAYGYGRDRQIAPWGALPGSPQVNPTPPMITGPGPGTSILPAYIPGLTAPVEPPAPLLSSSDWWVESVGGRIERDGSLVVDDPSQHYVEPEYDIQEDN